MSGDIGRVQAGDASRTSEVLNAAAAADVTVPSGPMPFAVDLYWLPLGAGGHSVRINGWVYEALAAFIGRRPRHDLYHSALQVNCGSLTTVIEMAPIVDAPPEERGVVAEGAVGSRRAGRWRLFRYGIRRWQDGVIPDIDEAVESPRRVTTSPEVARRVLELVPDVPTPVWGRDELGAGEMWNSNSVISWLLVRSGIAVVAIHPPAGGRAPGWDAGITVAGDSVARARDRGAESIGPAAG